MVILFLPKYINDAHPGQSINTVMCHNCDTWLTPYVEVLLYEYVVNLRRLSVDQCSRDFKGGSRNHFFLKSLECGLFFDPNACGLRLVCLCQLAWKNVEIIHSIRVKPWLFHCSGKQGTYCSLLTSPSALWPHRCFLMLPQPQAFFDLVSSALWSAFLKRRGIGSVHVQ